MRRLWEPKVSIEERIVYNPKKKEYNFLKNWRVVKYYITKKYSLTTSELELLLYFYDENVFTRRQFDEFCIILAWDKNRFKSLIEKELIRVWRQGKGSVANLYELTMKSKRICNTLYKKLDGEQITENPSQNKIMKGESYSDKVYRQMIRKMNAKS
jgi:DNA-binding MarR family transcriptional regulator